MLRDGHPPGSARRQTSRAKADELRKAGRFEEAAAEYAVLWPDGDPWTGWGYGYCLRKLGRFEEALKVARDVYALDPAFQFGASLYAWTLYDITIRGAQAPEPEVLKAAQIIVRLSIANEDAYAPTCPLVITVLRIARLLSDSRRDVRALEWLDKLDVNRLPVEPGKRQDERGREQELASRREQYYSLRTRSLERLGRWQQCLDTATRAFSECGRLHHDNEVWFARRTALAKKALGRPEEAFTELQQLAARKQAAFIQTEIAAAAWAAGDAASTFKHALQALLSPDDIGFKLEAVRLLAEVLWQRGEAAHARTHLSLCLAVRESRGWKANEELMKLASAWDVSGPRRDVEQILNELRSYWKRCREELSPRQTGVIRSIFPHGGAGFIRADGGGDLYFDTRDWKERNSKPAVGTPVTFVTRPSFDRKRQRQTTVASEVRPASVRA